MKETALWLAVIDRALIDALMNGRGHINQQAATRCAIEWLRINNKDFRDVCGYAGLEPSAVIKRYNERKECYMPKCYRKR